MASHVSQCMAKACMCDTWQAMCVTHGNMHGSFEAYIWGFKWSVLKGKGGSKLQSVGAARRRRGKGKRERRKGEEKGRKGEENGKKKREEEMRGREEKERGKGKSVAQ